MRHLCVLAAWDTPGAVSSAANNAGAPPRYLTLDELGGSAAHVEFHALPEERLRDIVEKRDRYEGHIRTILTDGIEQGRFREVDVKLTTLSLLGALNWTVVWWRPEGRWSSQDLVSGFTDVFLSGLLRSGETKGGTA